MKYILVALSLVSAFLYTVAYAASDVSNAEYKTTIEITNAGTALTNQVGVFALSTADMITNSMLNSSANECAILTGEGGNDVSFMPGWSTNPWCVMLDSIGAGSTLNRYLYTKNVTGGYIKYFPGSTGLAVPDNNTYLELGSNFDIKLSDTYLNITSAKTTLFKKGEIFDVYTAKSDTVGLNIYNINALDCEDDNSDFAAINDNNAFTFSSGGGTDTAFSITGWLKQESAGNNPFFAKGTSVAPEWTLNVYNGKLLANCYTDISNYIGSQSTATLSNATWYHVAMTYSASKTAAGVKLYINGDLANDTDANAGSYTGMTNTATSLYIGQCSGIGFFDGVLSNLKLYNVELTATEVNNDYYGIHKSANLVAWYKLIDGTGNPVDSSGNGYNAASNVADWITTGGKSQDLTLYKSGLTSGECDIEVEADSTNITILKDGVYQNSIALGGVSIPNDNSAWQFGDDDSTPYIGDIDTTVDGTPAAHWEWEYAATFTDSVNSIVATPSFRTTASDADLTGTVTAQEGLLTGTSPTATAVTGWEMVTATPDTPDNLYTEGGYNFPMGTQIAQTASDLGQNTEAWLYFIAFGLALFAAFAVYAVTNKTKLGQKGSLVLATLAAEGVLIYFYRTQTVSGWVLVPLGIIAVLLILWRKSPSPVD